MARHALSRSVTTDSSGTWQTQSVDTGGVGAASSLALDSAGKVHVTYLDATNALYGLETNLEMYGRIVLGLAPNTPLI